LVAFGFNQWWRAKPYPNSTEDGISDPFNDAYCKGQALGLCYSSEGLVNIAKNNEFLPADIKQAVDVAASALKDMTLQEACKIPLLGQISSALEDICNKCESYDVYGSILTFANKQCPLNDGTAAYCASKVFGVSSSGGTEPYEHCRPILLHEWEVYSLALAIPATLVAIAVIVSMILACTIKRREVQEETFYETQGRPYVVNNNKPHGENVYENQNPPYLSNNNNGVEYYT